MILRAHSRFEEYGRVVLFLADLFGLVWEISQMPYIDELEAITVTNGAPAPNPKRAFLGKMTKHIAALDNAAKADAEAGSRQTNTTQKRTHRKRRAA